MWGSGTRNKAIFQLGRGMKGDLVVYNSGSNNDITFSNNSNLEGNIYLSSPSSAGSTNLYLTDYGKINGNIYGKIDPNSKGTFSGSMTEAYGGTLNIDRGTLQGNIGDVDTPSNAGALSINFITGARMIGNIYTTSNDFQKKEVTFKGSDATIGSTALLTGHIGSWGTGVDNEQTRSTRSNHVVFEKGGMKGNVTAYQYGKKVGYNEVIFKQEGATLQGQVWARGGLGTNILGWNATNDITFEQNGKITDKVVTTSNDGSLGINNITFKNGGYLYSAQSYNGVINIYGVNGNVKVADVYAKAYRNSRGINNIYLKGGHNTVGADGLNIVSASDKSGANAVGGNFIKLEGDNNTISAYKLESWDNEQNKTIISLEGSSNVVNIGRNIYSNEKGKVYLGKNLIDASGGYIVDTYNYQNSNDAAKLVDKTSSANWTSDNNAFVGTMHVNQGITATNSSGTPSIFVSFKATNEQKSSIIDTWIRGSANTYLNITDATALNYGNGALANAAITGELKTHGTTTQNTYIKGNGKSIGMIGTIYNLDPNSKVNAIFEDAIFLPNSFSSATGNISSQGNGAITNVILRSTQNTNQIDMPVYKLETLAGDLNVISQGLNSVGFDAYYGKSNLSSNTTTIVFANQASGNDDFSANTDANANKFIGKTYQDGIKLVLKDRNITTSDNKSTTFITAYEKYFSSVANNGILNIRLNRQTTGNSGSVDNTITIKGLAVGDLYELGNGKLYTYKHNIILEEASAYVGNIASSNNITLTMKQGSKFLTDNTNLKIQNLTLDNLKFDNSAILKNTFEQNNTLVDIASMGNDLGNLDTRSDFRLLSIGGENNTEGLKGSNALFRVYSNISANQTQAKLAGTNSNNGSGTYGYSYADRILILSGDKGQNYLQTIIDKNVNLNDIKYTHGGTETAGNIAVATVKGTGDSQVATFMGAKQLQGFDVIGTTLTAVKTDVNGKVMLDSNQNTYTTYFLASAESKGASLADQNTSASALGNTYNLYLANMNSLNKRMGELRDNDNSQGVWARVFNGMQTTTFGQGTKSIYTTVQAGYDYAFGFSGANNYLGFALSYANSDTLSKHRELDINNIYKGISQVKSNGVELAIYNAYVQDGASKDTGWKNGFYSDTILKFSYINSQIGILNQNTDYSTNNFAFTASEEIGYRFMFGDFHQWIIDPQAELTFGYLDQSNFKQQLAGSSLDTVQNAIITLRGRVGSNFGYKFDKFTQGKNFKSKIYLGTYFVGDYINGGDISLTTDRGANISLNPLASTVRFTMNVGTDFAIKDHHRIYFDFERSFFGKIITDYQVNIGYRYSFGEGKHTSYANVNVDKSMKK